MALEKAGVQLVADGSAAFLRNMADGDKAVARFGQSATTASTKVSGFGQVVTGALRQVGAIAVNALADAGRAFAGFIGDSVKKAGDFEASMKVFGSVSGDALQQSGKSLKDFSDLFIKLGKELPVSTADVQQAAIELAKGGIDPATIAAGALRTSLNLAAAGGLGLADSATIMAKQLGVWVDASASAADKSDFLAQTANLLSQAANVTTSDVADMALGLANVGGVAKLTGLDFQSTVQTMALIAPSFSGASDAGTSFKAFLQRLQPTTKPAIKAMRSLGLYTDDVGSAFYDAKGQFVGMDRVAALLQKSTTGLSDAEKSLALQTIFGSDAIRVAALLSEKGAAGYDEMGKQLAGAGSVTEQAAARQQGFNTALENAKGSLEALQLTIGAALIPVLSNLLNTYIAPGINIVTEWAGAILNATDPMAALVASINSAVPGFTTFVGVVTAIAAFIGANLTPVLIGLGAVLTTVVVPAIASAVVAFGSAVVAGAPVVLALAALGVAAYAVYSAWQTNFGGIQQTTARVFAALTPIFTGLEPVFTSLVDLVSKVTAAFGDGGLGGAFTALQASLPSVTTALSTWASTAGTILLTLADQFITWVGPMIPKLLSKLGELALSLWKWIGDQAGPILAKLETWGTQFTTWVGPAVTKMLAEWPTHLDKFLTWIGDQAEPILKKLGDWGVSLVAWVLPKIPDLIVALGLFAGAIGTFIITSLPTLAKHTAKWAEELTKWIHDVAIPKLTPAWAEFSKKVETLLNDLQKQFNDSGKKFGDESEAWGFEMGERFKAKITEFINGRDLEHLIADFGAWGKRFGAALIPAILEGIGDLAGAIHKKITAAITSALSAGVIDGAVNGGTGGSSFGGNLGKSINSGIASAKGDVQAEQGIHSPSTVWGKDIGEPLAQGIGAGFVKGMGRVTATMVKQLEAATKVISDAADAVTKGTTAFPLLQSFKAPSAASVNAFTAATQMIVSSLGTVAQLFKTKWLEQTNVFNEAAAKGLGLISSGVDGLNKLRTFRAPSIASINAFTDIVLVLTQSLGTAAQIFKTEWLTHANGFTETASKGLSLIGAGVDGLTKLRTFKAPSIAALNAFTDTVILVVQSLGTAAQVFKDKWLAKAALFDDTAAKGLALVGSGIDGLIKLADFKAPSISAINAFGDTVTLLVQQLGTVAQVFKEKWLTQATAFTDAAAKGIGIIGSGIEGFTKLADYRGVPQTAIDRFATDLGAVIIKLIQVARDLGTKGPAAAAVFSDAVGKIIAPIGAAITTFTDLNKYKGVAPKAVELIGLDIAGVVGFLGVIAQDANTKGVAAATAFSASVGTIFNGLKSGLDFLTDLGKYKGVGPKQIQLLVDDINEIVKMTGTLVYQAGAAASSALEWENTMARYHDRIVAGLNSISSLHGLRASATVHASVDIDEGGGSNPPGTPPGTPPPTPKPQPIKYLALGGMALSGRPVVVGDGGRPEVIVPSVDSFVFPSISNYNRRISPPASAQQIAHNSTYSTTTYGPTLNFQPQYVMPAQPPQADFAIMSALIGGG